MVLCYLSEFCSICDDSVWSESVQSCQISSGWMSIIFNDRSNSLELISVTEILDLPYCGALWTDFRPSLNSLCHFLVLELLRHSSPKAFFSNAIVSLGVFSSRTQNSMQTCCMVFEFIFFFATQITLYLIHTVSLPVCKNQTIHHTTFLLHWSMQKTFYFLRISSLYLYCSHMSPTSIRRYRLLSHRDQLLGSNNTSCISYTIQSVGLFHDILTRFEPLYTNMSHIRPSDGTVSRYTHRFEIYGATFVYRATVQ